MLIDLVGGGRRASWRIRDISWTSVHDQLLARRIGLVTLVPRVNLSVMSTTAARATLVSPVVPSRRRGVAGTRRAFDPRPVEPARVARVGTTVRAESGSAGSDGAEDLALQWMALNYRPWVKSEADAAKCLNHLREKEGRVFNLDKAKEVLDSVKADHVKFYPNIPFKLPKTYPGFLLILERSSDKIS